MKSFVEVSNDAQGEELLLGGEVEKDLFTSVQQVNNVRQRSLLSPSHSMKPQVASSAIAESLMP